jgi:hypothetical protein
MVKVTIPFGNGGKIELDGSFDQVKAEVGKVDELFQKLNTAIGQVQTVTIQKETPAPVTIIETNNEPNKIPVIPMEIKKSASNAIVFLVENSWGQRGKKQVEINSALEANMIYKSRDLIHATLSQLVKYNKITRRKEADGDWMYYPALK